jgi:hypothetical protein
MDMLGIEENLTSCPAASNLFCVYHDGTMTPCFAVPAGMSASNINSGAMAELFFSDPLFRRIREESRRRSPMKCLHYENGWLNEFIREHHREMTIIGPALLRREARGREKAR